jgi:hypothetical protein
VEILLRLTEKEGLKRAAFGLFFCLSRATCLLLSMTTEQGLAAWSGPNMIGSTWQAGAQGGARCGQQFTSHAQDKGRAKQGLVGLVWGSHNIFGAG